MMKSVGKHFGLRRKCAPPKSRIDKKKTRVNPIDSLLDDSDEGSLASCSTSVSSGSEYRDSEDEPGSSDSSYRARDSDADDSSETDERRAPPRRQRKRPASAPSSDDDESESSDASSDSSSDVGGEPLRRAQQRKRLRLPDDSEDEALREKKRKAEITEAAAKRRERKNKLMELAKRRKNEEEEEDLEKNKAGNPKDEAADGEESSEDVENITPLNSSEEEKLENTSDCLKDFIVDEEEQNKSEDLEGDGDDKKMAFLSKMPRQFITGSQLGHFQLVVKALLINVLDASFLKSLYSGARKKRYAQEMKSSLFHFDERVVLPRLENLKQRSRWKERYKERVESYPKLRVIMTRMQSKGCEACELHRTGRFSVHLSGQLYHNDTLQEDSFMSSDSQVLFSAKGSVCGSRTKVYHALKHFKFHLFERCRTALEAQKEIQDEERGNNDDDEDEPVKDTVNKQYEKFQEDLNSADFFQEEKLD
ncbi:hypothetical protein DNTS_021788 [Danionella cerebrum]|uniref:DUF4211 domain-containing protein n=1 Tax=Danionella cerebrum TaxID=2873325 RepID=A0A553R853_9TELE|nr:hypothetical protein DNTS_021788 [Danionella translucida]